VGGSRRRPKKGSAREAEIAARRIIDAETCYKILSELASEGEHEITRFNASVALLNRHEGQPVQRNINIETKLRPLSPHKTLQ
jgi:hypothetical protein